MPQYRLFRRAPTAPGALVSQILSVRWVTSVTSNVWPSMSRVSSAPDASVISAIGQQNAKLGGLYGLVPLVLGADMVYLRHGGF